MLSIGKLAAGQAKYYLDQAEIRVDVVDSVAEGAEDYYLGAPEARGEWLGSLGASLGLDGPVQGEDLRRVLAGCDPRDGLPLRDGRGGIRVSGFDLTFSAPKSVSVLFGVGDDELRSSVRTAHDRAAREALGYLERSAAAVRRGPAGAVVEPVPGFVVAGFRHRTSRAGDPQLHTHLLVANMARGSDGRWSALDGRRLYAHARAASFIYQAVLRAELTRTVGVEWGTVRGGIGEVVGVPRRLREGFSRRRVEIEAALEEHGTRGPRAAEAAALATRRKKDVSQRPEDLVHEWRARAAELGFGREELGRVMGRARGRAAPSSDHELVFEDLAGPQGLTRSRATFCRRDVIQALCEAGLGGDARTIEAAADALLRSSNVVAIVPSAGEVVEVERFRRSDGRSIPASGELLRYSTREHLALERSLIERIAATTDSGSGLADAHVVRRAISSRPTLSDEQQQLIRRLCLDGAGVAVIAGKAGTGKTFALAAARESWQAAGYPVLGAAVARRAARGLQDGAGIESTSVAAMLGELRRGYGELRDQAVVVVDEAGMVPTRELAELVDRVERARGKLVLVGDHRQLPEIEAGGVFRGLVQRGFAIELNDNLRQAEAWERRALDLLRDGRAAEAVGLYAQHGRITVESTEERTRERMIDDWLAAGDRDRAVMIARRRVDVAELNRIARERLCATGEVAGPELELPGGHFAPGDRVVVKRNDRRRGVDNGDRGRILAVDREQGSLLAQVGDRQVVLDHDYLTDSTSDGEPTLLHGYAITGHVAQGLTVGRSYVLADEGISLEWGYVALSRGREQNQVYVCSQPDQARAEFAPTAGEAADPIGRLTARLQTSSAQILAIDAGQPMAQAGADDLLSLERAAAVAGAERRALENSKRAWLTSLTGARRRAHEREADARSQLVQARRQIAERKHGAVPHDLEREREASAARSAENLRERQAERMTRRERGFGREL